MALVVTNDNPLNAVPGMAGPGLAQYTAELRFKIVSELPAGDAGVGNDSLWWNVGGNWFTGVDSGPDIRMFEGKYPGGVFHVSRSGEGTQGSEPNNGNYDGDPANPSSSRGDWHTFRMIQDEVAGNQRVYIDGNLLYQFDISAYNRAFPFTRSTAFGFYNHPDNSVPHAEVHYDYIRIANGVVEPSEPINAVPEPATGLAALALCGLSLIARRRA
ncbi:MAG: hypothetical protein O2931_13335 [Planctomycetota bacterium]|nr:hypothetical protein [Planctomycetota bacterium]MDA1179766.1 hypothetical protein [Planctomycetota bacterium]